MELINWVFNNKEWVFSGIGVFIISLIIGIFLKNGKTNQKIKNHSSGIQAGRDVKITYKKK